MSCTEYFARPGYPDPAPGSGSWPGSFGWGCFGGRPSANASLQLNPEVNNMMKYLLKDSLGGAFQTRPQVKKAAWPAPYNQVVTPGSPYVVPTVRMPVTSGTFLYDIDANDLGSAGYRLILDLLIQNLTSQGVAVIIDQHGCCAGRAINCSSWGGPMALREFGNHSGALAFWDTVSSLYKDNDLVFYELCKFSRARPRAIQARARARKLRPQTHTPSRQRRAPLNTRPAKTDNEPHTWFQALQGGDYRYAGMTEMYDAVRHNAPKGMVVIGGSGWAQDSAGLLAIAEAYASKSGPMTNVLWNLHPYQGMFQGIWIALRSTMRLTLALQTIGPVIYTELGQYCCNANNTGQPVGKCNDHTHGDWFVNNLINMAAQLDVSWTGWAWTGTSGGDCGYPDMRAKGPEGVLTNGSMGGANWEEVWGKYVASKAVTVADDGDDSKIGVDDYEVKGFLPKPCIVPNFGMGGACGWPLGFNNSKLPFNSLWNQSVGDSVLPGLPPAGPPSACYQQACPGYSCSNSSPVVPMPRPCS